MPKVSYITPAHQKIMLYLLEKGSCCFSEQRVYPNHKAFFKAMNMLLKANWINHKQIILKNRPVDYFYISLNGRIITEEFIKDFIRCNHG